MKRVLLIIIAFLMALAIPFSSFADEDPPIFVRAGGPNWSSVAITGGAIDGTPIGATTPSTGAFTTVTTTGTIDPTIATTTAGGEIGINTQITHATNALTGELVGVRGNARVNAVDSAAGTVMGVKAQAGNTTVGSDLLTATGVYVDVVNKIPSGATTWTNARGYEVSMDLDQGSSGNVNTVTNAYMFYGVYNLPTVDTYATVTNGYGIFVRNEAVGGTGQMLDAAFYADDKSHSGGIYGWDYGIDFSGIGANSGAFGTADFRGQNGETISNSPDGAWTIGGNILIPNGSDFRVSTTTSAHEWSIQLYDNDDTTWRDGLNFANGNTPTITLGANVTLSGLGTLSLSSIDDYQVSGTSLNDMDMGFTVSQSLDGGADLGESNITNGGDIAADSISPDGATIEMGDSDEETHVQADGVPDSDDTYSCGMILWLTAGNAVKQFDLVAMQTDGKVDMANASMNTVIGFAVEESNDGWPAAEDESIGVCLLGSGGVIRNDGWTGHTAGEIVYVVDAGGTDGLFDPADEIDLEDGDHWTAVGVMQEEDVVIFPVPAWVTDDGS